MMGRTLFRYVLLDMLKALTVATAWLMTVGMLAVLVRAQFTSVGRLLGLADCLAMLPFLIPYLLSVVLPPAMLAASCSTFGRLAAENELTAMRAAGLSPRSIAMAPLALGLVASMLLLWLNLEGFRYAAVMLSKQELSNSMDVDRLCRPGSTLDLSSGSGKMTFSFGKPGAEAKRPVVVVSVPKRGQNGFKLSARDFTCEVTTVQRERNSRKQRFARFVLRDVTVVQQSPTASDKAEFEEYSLPDLELPSGMSRGLIGSGNMRVGLSDNLAAIKSYEIELERSLARYKEEQSTARSHQLATASGGGGSLTTLTVSRTVNSERDNVQDIMDDIQTVRAEASRKVSFSFSPLVFALLGIGLGAAARKASKLISLSLGVAAAAAYYGTWVGGRALAEYGVVPPELAPWLPNILGLFAAWFIVSRQSRS